MRLAFFGDGRMGRVAIARAQSEGHDVGIVFTAREAGLGPEALTARLREGKYDAAIDFSVATAVPAHAGACARAAVPLVEGTTGWQAEESEVRRVVDECHGTMVYGANFSIGVHLFSRVLARAADLFRGLEGYEAYIEEAHHAGKRDAPSGTALELERVLRQHLGAAHEIPITSTRAGHIPGTHRVGFDSVGDTILLVHTARSREGFADGAIAAAQWLATGGRRGGIFAFGDVLDEILASQRKGAAR